MEISKIRDAAAGGEIWNMIVSERLFPLKIDSLCNWIWFFWRLRRAIFEINRNKITMSCQHSWDFTAWISYFHRQYCLKGMSLLLTWGGLRILKLMEIRRTESYFWKVRTLISIRTRRTIRQHEIWWQTQGEGDPARVSWTLFEMWCLKLGNVPKPS